jgi:D-arabinose 5-phosphate isomerase GutQ
MGRGTSAAAARKIAHTISCIKRPAFFLSRADAPHGALRAVQSGDAVILVSKGGGTAELVSLLPPLEVKGAFLIAVISVFDAVAVALVGFTGYTRERFAVIHPGGAVGDRLHGREG